MVHIDGQWGTKINVHRDPMDVKIGFVNPQAPTREYMISHADAAKLRDALARDDVDIRFEVMEDERVMIWSSKGRSREEVVALLRKLLHHFETGDVERIG